VPQLAEGGGAHSARRPQGEIVEMANNVFMPGEARLMDERAGNLGSMTPGGQTRLLAITSILQQNHGRITVLLYGTSCSP
jgi:hypothetical protein